MAKKQKNCDPADDHRGKKGWASRRLNTSFVERRNAIDRHRNVRKARKPYRFGKDRQVHKVMTCLTMYG